MRLNVHASQRNVLKVMVERALTLGKLGECVQVERVPALTEKHLRDALQERLGVGEATALHVERCHVIIHSDDVARAERLQAA